MTQPDIFGPIRQAHDALHHAEEAADLARFELREALYQAWLAGASYQAIGDSIGRSKSYVQREVSLHPHYMR